MPPPPHFMITRKVGYDHVVIPFPVPPSLKCGLCLKPRGGGPWRTEERQANARRHLLEKHNGLGLKYKCTKCRDEFESSHGGRMHNPCRRSIAPTPSPIPSRTNTSSPAISRLCANSGASLNATPLTGAGASASPGSRADLTFAPSFLIDGKLILLYPGEPSRCPMDQCAEEFVTFDKRTGAMTSMHRHLHEAHGVKAVKFWRCSICGVEENGPG